MKNEIKSRYLITSIPITERKALWFVFDKSMSRPVSEHATRKQAQAALEKLS